MRSFGSALWAMVAVGHLAGCSAINPTPSTSTPAEAQDNHLINGHFTPGSSRYASLIPVELQRTPAAFLDRIVPVKNKKKGLVGVYGSQFYNSTINGYKGTDPKNRPPVCTLTASYPNDVTVDGKGDLIDPDGGNRDVIIYKPNCGPRLGTIVGGNYFAQPSDAASLNAATSTVIVGSVFGTLDMGGIAVCTLAGGCTAFLTNYSTIDKLAGVALAKNGDCWASAVSRAGPATLTYFKGCAGSGRAATGWKNTYFGGLDIDNKGNIVAVDAYVPQLWIYRGCNPACRAVGGPFPLHGDTIFGHLNRNSTEWVGGDYQNGMLDVYTYSTSALIYQYSISNGLSPNDDVEGAAFAPSSRQ
jgi:hypothetical protein